MLALLTAAGLFARGAFKAARAEPGFSLDRSVLVSLDPSLAGYTEARGRELYRRVLERVGDLDAELALLVIHGILHLVGYDHGTARDRRRMWKRQAALLAACGIRVPEGWAGPVNG